MTRLSLNLQEYALCIQDQSRELQPSKSWIEQYLSCLDNNCNQNIKIDEETKQTFANKLLSCISQCSTSKQPDFLKFESSCLISNIDEESSGDSSNFQLNTFLIAISVLFGIIILFVALVKWANIRKNRMNISKFSMKISPQTATTTTDTNMYPAMQLTTCNNVGQSPYKIPVQGLPCKEDELDKLSIFKAIHGAQKIKPSCIIFNDEKHQIPKDIFYPGKNIEVIQDKKSNDKKIDIPHLLITQIQINDTKDNQKIIDDYIQDKISLHENESPLPPINQIYTSLNKNDIQIKRLNLSKISNMVKSNETSTLTFLNRNSRDHQKITSRSDLQNYLIDLSPINSLQLNTLQSFRKQQIHNKQKGFQQQENKRPVSSKSFSQKIDENTIEQNLEYYEAKRRKSFDRN